MKGSTCFIGHRKISDTPRCSRFGARSSRFVIAKPCNGCGNPFSLKGRRILSRQALRMTSRLVIATTIKCAINCRPVIAVRVSGGHLCKAEAPTEPAGETAARCAAIRSLLRGIRILSRQALRMTSRLLIFGFIFVTFVTARAYFAFMRMVYCIAANAACVFKVRAIPVYMVNGTLFGKIANGAFAQRNSLV